MPHRGQKQSTACAAQIVDFKLPVYEIVRQSFEQLILKDSEQ